MQEQLEKAEAGVAKLLEGRNDRWYSTFHIAAAAGWINDPNGLIYFKGRYHVYFQHHPYSTVWGTMHWGHVSSEDMVTWRREPIAFAPSIEADRDGVFSGCAVVSDDGDTLYVYYTGHRDGADAGGQSFEAEQGSEAEQVQCLATSTDGVTFEKRGVVIPAPEGVSDFRDPKVWKMDGTWYMVLGVRSLENRGQMWLYTSTNMVDWEFDSILFEDPDPAVFMAECPDMFPVGDKWALAYSPMGGEIRGYSNRLRQSSGYVLGEWAPGYKFVALTDYTLGDWGYNFYAPQSFEAPDGRRIQYGWMCPFGNPLATQAKDGWAGQLTVPRTLTLSDDGAMLANPIDELTKLRLDTKEFGSFEMGRNERLLVSADAEAVEIEVEVDLRGSMEMGGRIIPSRVDRFGFEVHKTADGHHSYVNYDGLSGRVGIDQRLTYAGERSHRSAPVRGNSSVQGDDLHLGSGSARNDSVTRSDTLKLRIFIDRGSIEVFVNDGESVLSSFSFPGEGPRSIELVSESTPVTVRDLKVHKLGTIWAEPDR